MPSENSQGMASSDEDERRACDACRISKVRCRGKRKPPCARCAQLNKACTFGPTPNVRRRPRPSIDRVESLEQQVHQLHSSIALILEKLDAPGGPPSRSASALQDSSLTASLAAPQNAVPSWTQQSSSSNQAIGPSPAAKTTASPYVPGSANAQSHHSRFTPGSPELEDGVVEAGQIMRTLLEKHQSAHEGEDDPHLSKQGSSTHLDDPILLGWISLEEVKRLFELFMAKCHPFIPILDTETISWESVLLDSPLLLYAILRVMLSIHGQNSNKQLLDQMSRLVDAMLRNALLGPIKLETVQALLVLSSWSERLWRPAMFALTLALESGLDRAIVDLAASPSDVPADGAMRERARVWLTLCKVIIESAYNHGHPCPIPTEDIFPNASALLTPATNVASLTNARVVSAAELQVLRCPLNRLMLTIDSAQNDTRESLIDSVLRTYFSALVKWEMKWTDYYLRHGIPTDAFWISELATQALYSRAMGVSCILSNLHTPADVESASLERQQWLQNGYHASQLIVGRVVRGNEAENLIYANHFSRRLTSRRITYSQTCVFLLPRTVEESQQIARDILRLSEIVSKICPDLCGRQLLSLVTQARDRRILPSITALPSPVPEAATLPDHTSLNLDTTVDWSFVEDIFGTDWTSNWQPYTT